MILLLQGPIMVKDYRDYYPRKWILNWIERVCGIVLMLGLPVLSGCVGYLQGMSYWESVKAAIGVFFVVFLLLCAYGLVCWRLMILRLGSPLKSGERVQVTRGPLRGNQGTVKFPGQGGPLTLFVILDDEPPDVSVVFSWRDLRRA